MKIKQGVSMLGIKPEIVPALLAVDRIYRDLGHTAVITSCTEGNHSEISRHYLGMAIDIRVRQLKPGDAKKVAAQLRVDLGPEYFVYEHSTHIHIGYKPRR